MDRPADTLVVTSPRGTELTCQAWPQEAAMRMLMNNLDPEVAERPQDLVVYGGTGRAARHPALDDGLVLGLRQPLHEIAVVRGRLADRLLA